jgi:predicted secreted protein
MKRIISLCLSLCAFIITLSSVVCADEGDSLWSHTYGGNFDDRAYAITPTDDDGFLLAGYAASYGSGGFDVWLVKVNAQGDSLWSHSYGGGYEDAAYCLTPSGDGGFLIAGGTHSFGAGNEDMWLIKVNAQGDSLWSRTYGGYFDERAYSIIPSGDGGFLLAGSTTTFGSGNFDMWLVKVNAQGDSLWSRTFGGGFIDIAHAIISSGDGGFLMAGMTSSFGAGNYDFWLMKVDDQGDSLWSRTYGGSFNDYGYSISSAGDGGFLLLGYTMSFGAGYQDVWLVKVSAQGDSLWSHTYGGAFDETAFSLIPTRDNAFMLGGWTTSFGAGGYDMWLVKVNSQGDSLWSHTYGGSFWEYSFSLLACSDGGILSVGGTDSFGSGSYDMWLMKLEGSGTAVEPSSQIQPSSFALYPCHPNPFNPYTVASYKLPAASQVTLKVYDTAGRLVATLVDRWMQVGEHQTTFDGAHLSSGVYLAKLQAGEFTATQKLVLLK